MRTLIKIFIFLVMLLVVVAFALPMVLDPNDFKGQITEQVEKHTGRSFQIGGDIKMTVFPWLGVDLGQVKLGNAQGFGDQPFAEVEKAAVRVKLLPLLQKSLEVDTVVLHGFRANLVRAADGRTNWDDLAGKGEAKEKADDQGAAPAGALLVGGVDLQDAEINWTDQAGGQSLQLSGLNLSTGRLEPGKPLDVKLEGQVKLLPTGTTFRANLSGVVGLDSDHKKLTISPIYINVAELDGEQSLTVNAEMEFDMATGLLVAQAIQAEGNLRPGAGQPLFALNLNTQVAANLQSKRMAASPLELQLVEVKGKRSLKAGLKLEADLTAGNATLSNLVADAGPLHLKGQLALSDLNQTPKAAGTLTIDRFSPKALLQEWGVEPPATSDATVLEKFAASFNLAGSLQRLELRDVKFELDDTNLTGSASVAMGGKMAVGFDLNVDAINLDRYMAAAGKETGGDRTAAADESPTGLGPLFAVDLDGTFKLANLTVNNLKAGQIVLKVQQSNGQLQLEQTIGSFYKGSYSGNLALNGTANPPILSYKSSMKGLQVAGLLKDLTGQEPRLTGTGNVTTDIRSQGANSAALQQSLSGNVSANVTNGAIKGFNLAQIIRDAKSKITELGGGSSDTSTSTDSSAQTDFSELVAKATLKGPVVNNTELSIKAPYLRINGSGSLDTHKQWLDYRLRTTVVDSGVGQGGKGIEELENIPIPMKYQGSVAEVGNWRKWSIDFQDVIAGKLKKEAEARAKEELNKVLGSKLPIPGTSAEGSAEGEAKSPDKAITDKLKKFF